MENELVLLILNYFTYLNSAEQCIVEMFVGYVEMN